MNRFIVLTVLTLLMNNANAGLYGLTHHSRANCGNNETISWDALTEHMLEVVSYHVKNINGYYYGGHTEVDAFRNTWRSAAVCWGEGKDAPIPSNFWIVQGYHWMKDGKGKNYIVTQEKITDCSIYDGWWSK
jgi:hypothetical protein